MTISERSVDDDRIWVPEISPCRGCPAATVRCRIPAPEEEYLSTHLAQPLKTDAGPDRQRPQYVLSARTTKCCPQIAGAATRGTLSSKKFYLLSIWVPSRIPSKEYGFRQNLTEHEPYKASLSSWDFRYATLSIISSNSPLSFLTTGTAKRFHLYTVLWGLPQKFFLK